MIDVHLPTTDGKTVVLSRYIQPSKEVKMLLDTLKLAVASRATAASHYEQRSLNRPKRPCGGDLEAYINDLRRFRPRIG